MQLAVLQVVCFIWPNTKYCIIHKQVQAWKGVSSKGNRCLEDAPGEGGVLVVLCCLRFHQYVTRCGYLIDPTPG